MSGNNNEIVEAAFFASVSVTSSQVFDLEFIPAVLTGLVAYYAMYGLSFVRHRIAFSQSLPPGTQVVAFRFPPPHFGSPEYYPWYRHRTDYDATVDGFDTNPRDFQVLATGTFFGLFALDLRPYLMCECEDDCECEPVLIGRSSTSQPEA